MIETKHWLIEGINQWTQLFSKYNWYTWTFFQLEVEKENMTYGYELLLIVLGFGIRIRYNTDKALEQFDSWTEQIERQYESQPTPHL